MTYHNRHEAKFVVPETVAARVRQYVLPHVEPDPHAVRRPGHAYRIASLYLDDAKNSLYRETIEGRLERFKLRVRTYGDALGAPVFLEVKRRLDRVVQKLRCPIPRHALGAVLAGNPDAVPDAPQHDRESILEFVRLQQLRRAEPRLLVRYLRQAYVGRDQPEVRVTFDRHLAGAAQNAPAVRHDGRFSAVAVRGVILELKYTDICPPWILDVVHAFELQRRSFSKYCRTAEAVAAHDHGVAL